jgi:hypothetical protein
MDSFQTTEICQQNQMCVFWYTVNATLNLSFLSKIVFRLGGRLLNILLPA